MRHGYDVKRGFRPDSRAVRLLRNAWGYDRTVRMVVQALQQTPERSTRSIVAGFACYVRRDHRKGRYREQRWRVVNGKGKRRHAA